MRPTQYDFQWFDREDRRKRPRASLSRNGMLCLGTALRHQLPPTIRIGFDAKTKTLAIADGHGAGIRPNQNGSLSARALSRQITADGLRLPVQFEFHRDERTRFLLGSIVPQRVRDETGQLRYNAEQLLALYGYLIQDTARQMAKSTPLAERRDLAVETFYTAVEQYRPGYGNMETYLQERIRKELLLENKKFVASYRDKSLDQPLSTAEDGGSFCLYDTMDNATAGGIDAMEEQIMAEQFRDSLSGQERTLVDMLQSGFRIAQIAEILHIAEADVQRMGQTVAQKRRRFYRVP